MNVIRRVLKTVQYILCQACHSLEILEMVSSRSLVCEIASRICAAPLCPPLHRADLGSLLYRDTGGTKGTLYLAWVYCVVSSVYVSPSKVTSGAIVCLFGTAVPVSLSTWHFNLALKVQPSSMSRLHSKQHTVSCTRHSFGNFALQCQMSRMSGKDSRASLTVRFLRYEVEKGLRAV